MINNIIQSLCVNTNELVRMARAGLLGVYFFLKPILELLLNLSEFAVLAKISV